MIISSKYKDIWAGAAVFIGSFLLYIITLAPGIVYGDSAKFHMHIHDGYLGTGVNDHPLYLALGKLFTLLPFLDEAVKVNLVSAFFASLALVIVYALVRILTDFRLAGLLAAGVLAVSHTFWFHAVTSEVYSLHVFFVSLQICLLLTWQRTGHRKYLFLFFFCLSLSFDHLMTVLYIPAYTFFILRTDYRIVCRPAVLAGAAGSFVAGLAFYIVIFVFSAMRESVKGAFVEASALGHTGFMFSYSSPELVHFTLNYFRYLAYQFPFLGVFVGFWGLWVLRRQCDYMVTLLLMYLANVIFVVNYNETKDVFALFLPSYVVFAVWIGCGFADLARRPALAAGRRNTALVLIVLLIGLPVATYYVTPRLLTQMGKHPTGARLLPMRDDNIYYLWPPKSSQNGAVEYGKKVCSLVKPDAMILADNGNLARLVIYQQHVRGLRPDIEVPHVEGHREMINLIEEQIQERPVYLFTMEQDLYPISALQDDFNFVAVENNLLYEVIARGE